MAATWVISAARWGTPKWSSSAPVLTAGNVAAALLNPGCLLYTSSTLIRTINRMHDITQGTLTVDGTDVMSLHGKSLRKFRRKIGMIFQSFNLITRTTVIKNVLTAFVPDLPWWRATLGTVSYTHLDVYKRQTRFMHQLITAGR